MWILTHFIQVIINLSVVWRPKMVQRSGGGPLAVTEDIIFLHPSLCTIIRRRLPEGALRVRRRLVNSVVLRRFSYEDFVDKEQQPREKRVRHFPCLTISNKWLHLLLLGVVCCFGTLLFVTIQRGSLYEIQLIVDRSIGGTFYKNILKSVTDK